MTTQSKDLQTNTPSGKEQQGNNYQRLLSLLDPVVANAPHLGRPWIRLDRQVVTYLVNTVAKNKHPWLNHLSLALVIYCDSGAANSFSRASVLNRFLRWAIPDRYPGVTTLDPAEALVVYFGDPPQPKGEQALSAYNAQQLHMQPYLSSLSTGKREKLAPFLLPILVHTPKLVKLRMHVVNRQRAKRKEQTHAVVRDLVSLVAMGRQRYKWLSDLDVQVQQVAEAIKNEQATLPAVIKCPDLDKWQELVFRVWDRKSWIEAHRAKYCERIFNYDRDSDGVLFLQLVGALPETPWFLHAAEVGALYRHPLPAARKYLRDWKVPLFASTDGLLLAKSAQAQMIIRNQPKASGSPDDSRVLFWVEPLLAGAALGLFTLVSLTQTGMRIGEFQQVTLDETCTKIGRFPRFEGQAEQFSEELMFWYLYPKGKDDRQPYAVTPLMQEAMTIWLQTHERFCGNWQLVPADSYQFAHARRFPSRYKFALQWKGKHIQRQAVEACLDFLLLEHTCLDSSGQLTRISAHVLRHGVAGYLRNQGVPLEDIMDLLKQVNIAVTDYYSKLSPQDLYAKIGPALTRLGELAEIDPATIRTKDELNLLAQAALQRFGVLCHLPGGSCSCLQSCEIQFRCASCSSFVPDPARRHEVENKIATCKKLIRLCEAEGDFIQVRNQQSHLHSWERVLKEMDALVAVQLETRPLSERLIDLGVNKVSDETTSLFNHPPGWLPGGHEND